MYFVDAVADLLCDSGCNLYIFSHGHGALSQFADRNGDVARVLFGIGDAALRISRLGVYGVGTGYNIQKG